MSDAYDAVPLELRERPQWVVWRAEQRGGKTTKVPYVARAPVNRGASSGVRKRWRASTTDPTTWRTFFEAVNIAAADDWDGIGYVFAKDDPFAGLDLDVGLSETDRAAIIVALNSYTETSVSGQGAHVIVRASLNGHTRNREGPFEVYDRDRYFVVTGAHINGMPLTIERRQHELEMVLEHFLPPEPQRTNAVSASVPVNLDDVAVLDKAGAARNGAEFAALYAGTWEGRYPSQSEADLALCSKLAFWTGRDAGAIDRLFRASGLMRQKWLRADYRERTISEAVAGCRDVYTPPASRAKETPANRGPDRPAAAGQKAKVHKRSARSSRGTPAHTRARDTVVVVAHMYMRDVTQLSPAGQLAEWITCARESVSLTGSCDARERLKASVLCLPPASVYRLVYQRGS